MCNIWAVSQPEPELAVDKWVELLSSSVSTDLRELDITGGEPFLRDDLVSLIEAVGRLKGDHLKHLRSIAITTNGILTDRVIGAVEDMLGVMRDRGIELVVVCALDAVGPLHDQIRRHPGAWSSVQRTLAGLVRLRGEEPNLVLGLKTTVLPSNLGELEKIAAYARDLGLFTIISPAIVTAGRYLNLDRAPDLELSGEERVRLAGLYEQGLCGWTYHSKSVARSLRGGRTGRPCTCGFNYLFVRSNGDVFLCPLFEEPVGNVERTPLESVLTSSAARGVRERIGREPRCAVCTEPGLERYSLSYEGFAYLRELLRLGPRRFLELHKHLGLDKYL